MIKSAQIKTISGAIACIIFPFAVSSDSNPTITDLLSQLDNGPATHEVFSQCSGLLVFKLMQDDPKLNSLPPKNGITGSPIYPPKIQAELEAYKQKHKITFEMRAYFTTKIEAHYTESGLDFEHANYQQGMHSMIYSQQYRSAYLDVLEATGQPWANDSPFRAIYQAHMTVCKGLYDKREAQ